MLNVKPRQNLAGLHNKLNIRSTNCLLRARHIVSFLLVLVILLRPNGILGERRRVSQG